MHAMQSLLIDSLLLRDCLASTDVFCTLTHIQDQLTLGQYCHSNALIHGAAIILACPAAAACASAVHR